MFIFLCVYIYILYIICIFSENNKTITITDYITITEKSQNTKGEVIKTRCDTIV